MIHKLLTAAGCTLPVVDIMTFKVLPDGSHENRLHIPLISLQSSRIPDQSAADTTLRTAGLGGRGNKEMGEKVVCNFCMFCVSDWICFLKVLISSYRLGMLL